MKIQEWVEKAAKDLLAVGISNPQNEARLIIAFVLQKSKEWVFCFADHPLNPAHLFQANQCLKRRLAHEPLAKITEKKEFWKDTFFVNKYTLDPRPDSETLIQAVLETFPEKTKPYHILELGVGSGCLILSLLREYQNSLGFGVDISKEALNVAYKNALSLELQDRCFFWCGDWVQALCRPLSFDMIISNPPYIQQDAKLDPEVVNYDPHVALFAPENGLYHYQQFSLLLKPYLKPDGYVFFEIGYDQEEIVTELMKKEGWKIVTVYKDIGQHVRCLCFNR